MPYKDPKAAAACKQRWAEANRGKVRVASKKFYDANKGKVAALQKAYYEANPEIQPAYGRKYYKANKERITARNKTWAEANLGKVNAKTAKYYAAKLQRTPPWANMEEIERVYQLAAQESKIIGEPVHVDHIIPLQGKDVSGLHIETNLQILTGSENQAKCNRWSE